MQEICVTYSFIVDNPNIHNERTYAIWPFKDGVKIALPTSVTLLDSAYQQCSEFENADFENEETVQLKIASP